MQNRMTTATRICLRWIRSWGIDPANLSMIELADAMARWAGHQNFDDDFYDEFCQDAPLLAQRMMTRLRPPQRMGS